MIELLIILAVAWFILSCTPNKSEPKKGRHSA